MLLGVLLIGAVVIWAITGPPTGEFPPVSEVFVVFARVGFFIDALLIAGRTFHYPGSFLDMREARGASDVASSSNTQAQCAFERKGS